MATHARPFPGCFAVFGVAGAAVLLLAPWWRNRGYLCDLYDYGLVLAAVGRIDGGEKPYVDFLTPIQTATFLFNGWADRWGGGTFQAMTLAAGVLVVLPVALLQALLSRVWGQGLALAVAGAVVAGTVVQHTIVWHNSLGVVCLAMVAWVGALTKLNVHLVAIAVALGWGLASSSA